MNNLVKAQSYFKSNSMKIELLRSARNFYENKLGERLIGMCTALILVLNKQYGFNGLISCDLEKIIPKFNSMYLSGKKYSHQDYWWQLDNHSARFKAFDKLIHHYEKKERRWKWLFRLLS